MLHAALAWRVTFTENVDWTWKKEFQKNCADYFLHAIWEEVLHFRDQFFALRLGVALSDEPGNQFGLSFRQIQQTFVANVLFFSSHFGLVELGGPSINYVTFREVHNYDCFKALSRKYACDRLSGHLGRLVFRIKYAFRAHTPPWWRSLWTVPYRTLRRCCGTSNLVGNSLLS